MPKIVQVKLRESGRTLYLQARKLDLGIGEEVIVEIERGEELGEVISRQELAHREFKREESLKKVKRIATAADKKRWEENKRKKEEALKSCLKKIEDREIPMK